MSRPQLRPNSKRGISLALGLLLPLALISAVNPLTAVAGTSVVPDVVLQTHLIGQRFSPQDPSGDNGDYDCLPASLAMALSALETAAGQTTAVSYQAVRQYMRSQAAQSGIPWYSGLSQTYGVIEHVTNGLFVADPTYHQADSGNWRDFLEGELSAGRPIVIYVADASLISASEVFPDAHAMVVVGLTHNEDTVVIDDPWNETPTSSSPTAGHQFEIASDAFAAAWGNNRLHNGRAYQGANWSYIGFYSSSSPAITPQATATPKTNITPTSQLEPGSQVPNAPTNLTDAYLGDGPCPDIAGGDCPKYTFSWSNGGGVVNGYSIYVEGSNKWNDTTEPDPQQAAAECAQATLSDLLVVATVSGDTTSYTFYDETPDHMHSCVVVIASNDAGSSSRAVAVPPPVGRGVG